MRNEETLRFAIVDNLKPLTSIWRAWRWKGDVYVAPRAIAGSYKIRGRFADSLTDWVRAGEELIARRAAVVAVPVEIGTTDEDVSAVNPYSRAAALSFAVGWNSRPFRLVEATLGSGATQDAGLSANASQPQNG